MKSLTPRRRLLSAAVAILLTFTATAIRGQSTRPTTEESDIDTSKSGPPVYAVMASFPEELTAIEAAMLPKNVATHKSQINGVEFEAAEIAGKRHLFFLTGMSLVNASMNTQLVLDHFNVRAVFFCGIAGGIDPAFHPGDVVVPARWHYHSETAYFNESRPGEYALADYFKPHYKNFGMIFPDDVWVKRDGMNDWQQVAAFPADPLLLAGATAAVAAMPPIRSGDATCKIVVGGDGVSGTVFCDNADYRKWVFDVWHAECLDMESAAIAHVCWQNKTPCLIVRGLSDLAGGQAGKNEEEQYLQIAAKNAATVLAAILGQR